MTGAQAPPDSDRSRINDWRIYNRTYQFFAIPCDTCGQIFISEGYSAIFNSKEHIINSGIPRRCRLDKLIVAILQVDKLIRRCIGLRCAGLDHHGVPLLSILFEELKCGAGQRHIIPVNLFHGNVCRVNLVCVSDMIIPVCHDRTRDGSAAR